MKWREWNPLLPRTLGVTVTNPHTETTGGKPSIIKSCPNRSTTVPHPLHTKGMLMRQCPCSDSPLPPPPPPGSRPGTSISLAVFLRYFRVVLMLVPHAFGHHPLTVLGPASVAFPSDERNGKLKEPRVWCCWRHGTSRSQTYVRWVSSRRKCDPPSLPNRESPWVYLKPSISVILLCLVPFFQLHNFRHFYVVQTKRVTRYKK